MTQAIWISKSDKLIEDARRDWCALGSFETKIVALSKYKQGQPILLNQAIPFTTYTTLRSAEKTRKPSRLQQILTWVKAEFEGVIAFYESYAMGNAASEKGRRGIKRRLSRALSDCVCKTRFPQARVLYLRHRSD